MTPHIRLEKPVASTLMLVLTAAPLLPVYLYVDGASAYLRLLSGLLAGVALVALVRFVVVEIRHRRPFAQSVLILGMGPMAPKVVDAIATADDRYSLLGVVDEKRPKLTSQDGPLWLGPPSRLDEIVERVRPARIVVALANRRGHFPFELLLRWRVHGVEIEEAHEFYERVTGKIAIEALKPSTLILAKGFRNGLAVRLLARLTSVIAAVAGLVLLAPLFGLIAVAIRLDSRGPVFFVQERAGKGGRPFPLLKFRTMHPTPAAPSEWVQDNTDRITRVGAWLRRFRLDELPQLVNVLRGDMNLIGPRPHPVCNHALFMTHIAYYDIRSSLRPGVTGWAQVRYGYANNLEEETEKMRYDLYYIKNRSIWLDLRILAETVITVVLGRGSAEVRRQRRAPCASPAERRLDRPGAAATRASSDPSTELDEACA